MLLEIAKLVVVAQVVCVVDENLVPENVVSRKEGIVVVVLSNELLQVGNVPVVLDALAEVKKYF